MNILMLSWRDPKHPLAGGAEQVMHQHAKGWIAAGHKVTLFSSRFSGSSITEQLDDIQIIRGGSQNFLGVQLAAFFYYLKNKNKFDFLVDMFHGYPFFTPLYSRKLKLAVIQEVAREVWFLNPLPKPINWIVGAIGYITEPLVFLFYKFTPFMTGSETAKSEVSKIGIDIKNITVVPHGVLIQKPKINKGKEKVFTLVFLGVLSQDKGIEDALVSFSLLQEKGNFQFWVIGRPETEKYGDRITKLAKKLELKNIKFWGFVSQEKKFELLRRAHVLVNPSVREGWGLVNIEANAMGTPVVAYNSPGLTDSVINGKSGIIIQNNTPESISQEIIKLVNDGAEYKSLASEGVKWSSKFSWKESSRASLSLIEKIYKQI